MGSHQVINFLTDKKRREREKRLRDWKKLVKLSID